MEDYTEVYGRQVIMSSSQDSNFSMNNSYKLKEQVVEYLYEYLISLGYSQSSHYRLLGMQKDWWIISKLMKDYQQIRMTHYSSINLTQFPINTPQEHTAAHP